MLGKVNKIKAVSENSIVIQDITNSEIIIELNSKKDFDKFFNSFSNKLEEINIFLQNLTPVVQENKDGILFKLKNEIEKEISSKNAERAENIFKDISNKGKKINALIVVPKTPWGTNVDDLYDELIKANFEVEEFHTSYLSGDRKKLEKQKLEIYKLIDNCDVLLMPDSFIIDYWIGWGANDLSDYALSKKKMFYEFKADWAGYSTDFDNIEFEDDAIKITTYITNNLQEKIDKENNLINENEFAALTIVDGQIRLVYLQPDGQFRFVDEKKTKHNIFYTYAVENISLYKAIDEFEFLINQNEINNKQLIDFFERFPEFILTPKYQKAHSKIVLSHNDYKFNPDFILEPLNNKKYFDVLQIQNPNELILDYNNNISYLSKTLSYYVGLLRKYNSFFNEKIHRTSIYKNYGLQGYKPNLFIIIGRDNQISPMDLRNIEIENKGLFVNTYDDVLSRMKYKLKMK